MRKHFSYIIILLIISSATALLPYFFSDFFPPWKDSIAVACAVKHIDQNHTLGVGERVYTTFDIPQISYCWGEEIYPLNQIYQYSFKVFSGLDPALTVSLVYLMLYLLIVLGIYLVSHEIHQKQYLAFVSAFLAANSLALLRIFMISAHQLFGFLAIIAMAWFLVRYERARQKKYLFLVTFVLLNLAFLHQFSLAVISVALAGYFIARLKKKLFILPAIVLLGGIIIIAASFLGQGKGPLYLILSFIHNASTVGMVDTLSAHPLWDHPTILGYVLSILGVFGAFYCLFKPKFPLKTFWWTLTVFCVLMAHSYIFGFYLIGYRFLFFLFIPFSILAPLFFVYLKGLLPKLSHFLIPFAIIFIAIGASLHSINFLMDDFTGMSKRVLPPTELKQAISWLNENSQPEDTILTVTHGDQKYAAYLPYLYHGNVMAYPVFLFTDFYKFEFKSKLYKFIYTDQTEDKGTYLSRLIKPYFQEQLAKTENFEQSQKDTQQLFNMFQMIAHPRDKATKKIFKKYQVKYVLAWRGEIENKIYYKLKGFEPVYTNDLLVIYKYKKLK